MDTAPYTGTLQVPDVVSIFLKSDNIPGGILIDDPYVVNQMAYTNLFDFSFPAQRIKEALRVIFQEFKQRSFLRKDSEILNACKNLFRGVVQFVPLLGSGSLYLYDQVRIHCYTHQILKMALRKERGPVVGIAFDGIPVFTIPAETLHRKLRREGGIHQLESQKGLNTMLSIMWSKKRVEALNDENTATTPLRTARQIKKWIEE